MAGSIFQTFQRGDFQKSDIEIILNADGFNEVIDGYFRKKDALLSSERGLECVFFLDDQKGKTEITILFAKPYFKLNFLANLITNSMAAMLLVINFQWIAVLAVVFIYFIVDWLLCQHIKSCTKKTVARLFAT